MIYSMAAGISIEESDEGGFLVASRPLRMVRLNPPLLALARRMEHGGRGQGAAATRRQG